MLQEKNIVLNLKAGANFPNRSGESLYAKAKLNNVVLETDHIPSTTNPVFESELVWETTRSHLTQMRSNNACIKVDFYSGGKLVGYKVLDLKSGVPTLRVGDVPPTTLTKLLGSRDQPTPLVELGVYIEEEETSVNITPRTLSKETTPRPRPSTSSKEQLEPILDAEHGYFQIGKPGESTNAFQFKLSICKTSNLKMLQPNVNPEISSIYCIRYELLGTELSTASSNDLNFKDLQADVVTANIRSNPATLAAFLANHGIQINVCQADLVIGTVDVDVGKLLGVGDTVSELVQYTGDIPVVASYSLKTPRDADGQMPMVNVFMSVAPDPQAASSKSTGNDIEMREMSHISEGDLSDATTMSDSNNTLKQNKAVINPSTFQPLSPESPESPFQPVADHQHQQTTAGVAGEVEDGGQNAPGRPKPQFMPPSSLNDPVPQFIPPSSLTAPVPQFIPPSSLTAPVPQFIPPSSLTAPVPQIAPLSPPTKLPRESFANTTCGNSTLQGDETDYISPPPLKSPRLSPVLDKSPRLASKPAKSAKSVSTVSQAKLPRKFFIDLEKVRLLETQSNLSLGYTYQHISSQRITTGEFCAPAGEETEVVNGSFEFNFAATQAQLEVAFREYKLKVNLYNNKQMVGSCSVGMEAVLGAKAEDGLQEWSGLATVVSETGLLGHLVINLHLQTYNKAGTSGTSSKKASAKRNLMGPDGSLKKNGRTGTDEGQQTESIQPQRSKVGQRVDDGRTSVSDQLLKMEMLSQAAKELEIWKNNEKKKFTEQLTQVEAQHVELLGREWREREAARVQFHNNKQKQLQDLEKELTTKLEDIKSREAQLDKDKKSVEEDLKRLKHDRVDNIQKLKKELKNKEMETIQKNTEIQVLNGKVRAAEQEVKKVKLEKDKKREGHMNLVNDVKRLKEDNLVLQKDLEVMTEGVKSRDSKLSELRLENTSLKQVQAKQIQELTESLTRLAQPSKSSPQPSPRAAITQSEEFKQPKDPSRQFNKKADITPSPRTPRSESSSGLRRNAETQVSAAEDVNILKKIHRLEEEKMMLLRAGLSPDDNIVMLIQKAVEDLTGEP